MAKKCTSRQSADDWRLMIDCLLDRYRKIALENVVLHGSDYAASERPAQSEGTGLEAKTSAAEEWAIYSA